MSVSNRRIAAGIGIWACAVGGAFWHLEGRYLRPVARPAGAAQWQPRQQPLTPLASLPTDRGNVDLTAPGRMTLLNFWNPGCACSQFSEGQVRALAQTFAPRGVQFVTVIECGKTAARLDALAAWRERGMPAMPVAVDAGGATARRFGVWAAPGAAIINGAGHLVYVGAYNAARFCDNARTAWARLALEATLEGQLPQHPTTPFYGCQIAGK